MSGSSGSRSRRRLLDALVGILLAVGAFALYVSTLAPTVLSGDGGEFQFVPYLLGVAHPTGYPLYSLLGWAWTHLVLVGDVAYRMNLFSAFWSALAVGLLYPTARLFLRQACPDLPPVALRLVAGLSAATLAVTPTLWSQSIIAEVYSLQLFLVVLLFYLLLRWSGRRTQTSSSEEDTAGATQSGRGGGERLLLLAAACFGLGLAHHSTTLLLAPAFLAFAWLTDRRVYRDWRLVLKLLVLAVLPLLLYLYLPWRAPHTPYLRLPLDGSRELVLYENTLGGLVGFVMGGPFGGYLDLSIDLGARLGMAWGFLRDELGWVALMLAIGGLTRLIVTRRWALLALTGLVFAVTVAFNLLYTIGDIYVLFIPAYLILVVWMATGVATLARILAKAWLLLEQRIGHGKSPERSLTTGWSAFGWMAFAVPFFVLPVWMAVTHYASVDQSRNTRARTRWESILAEPLPREAVLISDDRNNIMPMWYFQYVGDEEPLRPDLLGLFPLITPDQATLGHVLDLALSTGRPVYLIKEMPGVEVKVATEAEGRLWHVLGPAVDGEPAYPRSIQLDGAVVLTGYDRAPHSPRPGDTLQVSLYWEAQQPLEVDYHSFVHLLDAGGQAVVQSDQQPGGVYYPTSFWRPGERLRDDHFLTVPTGTPDGVYDLLAGMYALGSGGQLEPLGEPVVIGSAGVKTSVRTEPDPISHPVGASFDDQIELLGYDATPEDREVAITLHWRSIQVPRADYTVFVHLLGSDGQVVSQHDGPPQDGAYPTSAWDAGEVVVDGRILLLPPDLTPDLYSLWVGLYVPASGERLPVAGGGDRVKLGSARLGN
jgi:hypothetical protein